MKRALLIASLALAASTAQASSFCNWVHDMAILVEAQKQNGQSKATTLRYAKETFSNQSEFSIVQVLVDQSYKLPVAPPQQRGQWISLFAKEQYQICMGKR